MPRGGGSSAPRGGSSAPRGGSRAPRGWVSCPEGQVKCPEGQVKCSEGQVKCSEVRVKCAEGRVSCPEGAGLHRCSEGRVTLGVFNFMQRHADRSAGDLKQCMPIKKFVRLETTPKLSRVRTPPPPPNCKRSILSPICLCSAA